jgi:hypothetical protein
VVAIWLQFDVVRGPSSCISTIAVEHTVGTTKKVMSRLQAIALATPSPFQSAPFKTLLYNNHPLAYAVSSPTGNAYNNQLERKLLWLIALMDNYMFCWLNLSVKFVLVLLTDEGTVVET